MPPPPDTEVPAPPSTRVRRFTRAERWVHRATAALMGTCVATAACLYLPEFADMKVMDAQGQTRPAARPILIRDIMRHTAGFSYGGMATPADAAFQALDPLNLKNDLTEFGHRIAKAPLLFDPGEEWSYSAAVDVQALLVEKLTGESK